MRILYLTDNLDYKNGWGRYALDLINGMERLGCVTAVLTKQWESSTNVFKKVKNTLIFILKIREYSKECDIIHALDAYPFGILAVLANIGRKQKFVITGQGAYSVVPFYKYRLSVILKWAYKKANGVVAISEYTKQRILEKVGSIKVDVIEHGIDLNKFSRARANSSDKYILSVGALKTRKGLHVSIPAFALAKKRIPDLKYKIVGDQRDATYFNDLKKIIADYGIEKDVVFIYNVSDEELCSLYAGARLFILTSVNEGNNFEGFGLVFLEAAAAGLPVIGTKKNGISSAIKEDCNGLLVEQGNVKETADAIIKIVCDDDLNKRFSQYSYKWVKEHTLEHMANKYLNFYKGILSK